MKSFKKAQKIVARSCQDVGIPGEWLVGGLRTPTVAKLRQALVVRLRRDTDLSWREIGLLCGYSGRACISRQKKEAMARSLITVNK